MVYRQLFALSILVMIWMLGCSDGSSVKEPALPENIYLYDKVELKSFDLLVSSSTLQQSELSIVKQLQPIEKALRLEHRNVPMVANYSRGVGFSVLPPELEISLINPAGVKDPGQVEAGLVELMDGYRQAAYGSTEMVKGWLNGYLSADTSAFEDLTVTVRGDSLIHEYIMAQNHVRKVYCGFRMIATEIGPGYNYVTNMEFELLEDSMVPFKSHMVGQQGGLGVEMSIQASNRVKDGVVYPERLNVQSAYTVAGNLHAVDMSFQFDLQNLQLK